MKWIKKPFEEAKEWFSFSDEKAKKIARTSIKVTNVVKTIFDSPIPNIGAFILKKAIPGEADDIVIDSLLSKAEILLPKLIAEETIVLGLLEGSSVEEKANYVLSKIKFANDEQKDEFAHKFCIRLVLALSDGKITYGEAVILAEMAYQELKRNNQL